MTTFTCDSCGGRFESGSSDSEAMAEALELFGGQIEESDRGILCDDCYERFLEWFGGLSDDAKAAFEREG